MALKPLDNLSRMEYPGRVIIIGLDPSGSRCLVIYAITGRSPSSQARRLEQREGGIWVQPTDEETLKKGNVDLLVYPALQFGRGIAVSNGKQTTDIHRWISASDDPVNVLSSSLAYWDYEPDAPIFTPRISGCVLPGFKAGLSIIKRGRQAAALKNFYAFSLEQGWGKLVATYAGPNVHPLPVFAGDPQEIELGEKNASDMAEAVYESLKPASPEEDIRVSVACVCSDLLHPEGDEVFIINRKERT